MTWFQRAVRPATIAVTALLIAGFSGPGFADGANSVPFALIDHGGRAVTDTDFHGSYLLIFSATRSVRIFARPISPNGRRRRRSGR